MTQALVRAGALAGTRHVSNVPWPCRSTGGPEFQPASHRKVSMVASRRAAFRRPASWRADSTPAIARLASRETSRRLMAPLSYVPMRPEPMARPLNPRSWSSRASSIRAVDTGSSMSMRPDRA